MSGISGYNQYNYYRNTEIFSTSGTSGSDGSDIISKYCSGAAEELYADDTSGASGASGYVYIGSVENLTIDEIFGLFTHGNLTRAEMDKWLNAHKNSVKDIKQTIQDNVITYTFRYEGLNYKISCTIEAETSQTDSITVKTFYPQDLSNYGFTEEDINQYFLVSYSGGMVLYSINPNETDCKTLDELKEHIQQAQSGNTGSFDPDGMDIDINQMCPTELRELLEKHFGSIDSAREKAQAQGLNLVIDEFEYSLGRIVAEDEDGMYYFYTKANGGEFIKYSHEDMVDEILYRKSLRYLGTRFNITDVIRTVDRENEANRSPEEKTARKIIAKFDSFDDLDEKNTTKIAVNILNSAFQKFDCQTDDEKVKLTSTILKLYNQYKTPQITSADDLSKVDLATWGQIPNSPALYFTYLCDGEIEDFKNILNYKNLEINSDAKSAAMSAIMAIASTEEGQEIFKNMIENMVWKDDYKTVTMTTPAGKEYTFAINLNYCIQGDSDAQILLKLFSENICNLSTHPEKYLEAFLGKDAIVCTDNSVWSSDIKNVLNQLYNSKQDEENFLFTFNLYNSNDEIKCTNGTTFFHEKDMYVKSSYTVIDITSDTVQFMETLDSSKVYTVTWEEFQKLNMYQICTVRYSKEEAELLNKKEGVTSDYIVENLDRLQNSKEPGVKNFVSFLCDTFEKFECVCDIDQKDFLDFFINWYNKENNIEASSTPPMLTHETLAKLCEPETIQKMQGIIEGNTFNIQYLSDGIIGETLQGSEGDCWLLAAINSLAATPQGAKIIEEAITWADDNHINVHFAGINKDIVLDVGEIMALYSGEKYNNNGKKFSRGDIDVLILEYAVETLYLEEGYHNSDISGGEAQIFWKLFIESEPHNMMINGSTNPNQKFLDRRLDEVTTKELVYEEVRKANGKYQFYTVKDIIEKLYEKFHNGEFACASFVLQHNGDNTETKKTTYFSATDVGGKKFECEIGTAHIFSIKNVTMVDGKYYITIVNPWNTDYYEYTFDLETFMSLGIYELDYVI